MITNKFATLLKERCAECAVRAFAIILPDDFDTDIKRCALSDLKNHLANHHYKLSEMHEDSQETAATIVKRVLQLNPTSPIKKVISDVLEAFEAIERLVDERMHGIDELQGAKTWFKQDALKPHLQPLQDTICRIVNPKDKKRAQTALQWAKVALDVAQTKDADVVIDLDATFSRVNGNRRA